MKSISDTKELLEEFLFYPLDRTEEIFARFEALPGAVFGRGEHPMERYVCVPGSRENRIVLVAHADTVWDAAYGRPAEGAVCFEDGVFKSANPNCGIGADDRAGCAMLWALRNSGHTLLLVNGEEKGKIGARFLRKSNPELFKELNRHRFMIELDWRGTGGCLFNQVDYTKRFHDYITDVLGFQDDRTSGGCDLQVLCHKICGVNVGVGYYGWHRPGECLNVQEWENTYNCLLKFLESEHPQFPISRWKRMRRFLGRIKGKIWRILKLEK